MEIPMITANNKNNLKKTEISAAIRGVIKERTTYVKFNNELNTWIITKGRSNRIIKKTEKKNEAIDFALAYAKKTNTALSVYDKNGKIFKASRLGDFKLYDSE